MVKEGKYPTIFDENTDKILDFFAPLKEASEKTGVIISQMHAHFPVWYKDEEEFNKFSLEVLDKTLAVCEYLSCPALVVHPVKASTHEEEYDTNLNIYRSLIPSVKKRKGVQICLENLFKKRGPRVIEANIANGYDICRMIDTLNEEAGGEYFAFCFDTGHANMTGHDMKEYLKSFGSKVKVLHIHDNNGVEDLHLLPYSYMMSKDDLCCDWNGFVNGLKEIGYNGVLSFETFRIFKAFPKEVHTEVLKLISAIGRCWAEQLSNKDI